MRMLLIIGALATILIGCSCLPPWTMDGCAGGNGLACPGTTVAGSLIEQWPETSKPDPIAKSARATPRAKVSDGSSARPGDGSGSATKKTKPAGGTKAVGSSSTQLGDKSDPVTIEAKIAIASKMEDPASVEFVEMKRAMRKNMLGDSIDTICGYVKGKTTSGEDTGERPFIYIVKEKDAFVVDDSGDLIAVTTYGNICN
jgi:hypothetical protein